MSVRQARRASAPTTFCSSMAGTSASNTRPDRPIRRCAYRRSISASNGCAGWKPVRSSSAPSSPGRAASTQAAPGPQAQASTVVPSPVACLAGSGVGRDPQVAGPCGVRDVRHTAPEGSTRKAGSPVPLRCTPTVRARSTRNGACQRPVTITSGRVPPAAWRTGQVPAAGPRRHRGYTRLHVRGEADRGRAEVHPRPHPHARPQLVPARHARIRRRPRPRRAPPRPRSAPRVPAPRR